MLAPRVAICLILLELTILTAAAGPKVGDQASAIKVAKWVTTKPTALPGEAGAAKQVFLVEFWATWLPTSKKVVVQLSELQEKHAADGLVVIAISSEEPGEIAAHFKKKGLPPFAIAADDDMATTTAWTKEEIEIPYALLVDRTGAVVWSGDPLKDDEGLAKVIDEVLAGKFDVKTAKRSAEEGAQYTQLMEELQTAYAMKDENKVFKVLDELIALKPQELQPYLIKREALRKFGRADRVTDWDTKILKAMHNNAGALHELCLIEMEKDIADQNPAMLYHAAERASELAKGRDAALLAILARAQCDCGMINTAIATQRRAVAKAKDEDADYHRKLLRHYEAAAKVAKEMRRKAPTSMPTTQESEDTPKGDTNPVEDTPRPDAEP